MATTTTSAASAGKAAPSGKAGKGARIRMYRVGFGDFFLLSVPAGPSGAMAHVLVDCGVHAHDLGVMGAAVDQLKADTGGRLALVIMTHRHADHISGFGSASDVFKTFTVERVWMSWFENPGDSDAQRIQAGIAATAQRLQAALALRAAEPGPDDRQYAHMAGNALGAGKGGNAAALAMLHSFRTAEGKPTPVDYYTAGDAAILPPSLAKAGLAAEILGPPKDLALVAKMDNAAHQYLAMEEAGEASGGEAKPLFHQVYGRPDFKWRARGASVFPLEDVAANIRSAQPDALAVAAKKADNALNNQSLVVLFTFAGKTMLFSGDAQWGNWASFLFGGDIGTPGHTALRPESKAILGQLDFYKVGHHGSTNATPMDVIAAMKQGCYAMCSTDAGAYGNKDKGTEVPRKPLMDALSARSGQRLARSDMVPVGDKPRNEELPPLAAPFVEGPSGSIDLWL
jgi:beta-lactamase superfamily II metal-dependent hydrolase